MTTAEKTLKWWNDYLEQNKTYPLIAEIEMQLKLAVDNEPKVNNLAIHGVSQQRELLIAYHMNTLFDQKSEENRKYVEAAVDVYLSNL